MKLRGPERYQLTITPERFDVRCSRGTTRFSGIAAERLPKLYVVADDELPVYVGMTRSRLQQRFRSGWTADGRTGYYGYAWRSRLEAATVDVWCWDGPDDVAATSAVETIEAEVVFRIRAAGQWPLHQTEIHFHPSKSEHRSIAESIVAIYPKLAAPSR
jgi:hypothetical protein